MITKSCDWCGKHASEIALREITYFTHMCEECYAKMVRVRCRACGEFAGYACMEDTIRLTCTKCWATITPSYNQ